MGLGCIHLAYVDDAFFKVGISSYLPPGTWGLHSTSVSSSSARTKNYTTKQEGWIFPTLLKKPYIMFITGLQDFPRLHTLVVFRPNLETKAPLWLYRTTPNPRQELILTGPDDQGTA